MQGRAHAHAIAATRPLTGIRLAARDLAKTRKVAADLEGQLGLPVHAADSVPEAVAGAGIVVTATSAPEPVLRREWLAPGTHVNAVGACVPGDRELDTAVRAELGELLTGTASGRSGDDEITVFESLGLAAEDLAAASFLYQKATRLGAGTAADF